MLLFLIACAVKSTPIILRSTISIHDAEVRQRKLSLVAQEALINSRTDWWQPLPVIRRVIPMEEWTAEKIEADSTQLAKWFVERGWRDVSVQATSTPTLQRGINAIEVGYLVDLGDRWTIQTVVVEGLQRAPFELSSIPDGVIEWDAKIQESITKEIRHKLGLMGFADVQIHWQSRKVGEKEIILECYVSPRQIYQFGFITTKDLSQKEDADIHEMYPSDYLLGKAYSIERSNRIAHRLEKIPAYRDVEIISELDREKQHVNLKIRYQPKERWTSSPVLKTASEATTFSIAGGTNWSFHHNRGASLSMTGVHDIGYRFFPQISTGESALKEAVNLGYHGFTTNQQFYLSKPVFPLGGTAIFFSGGGAVDAQFGYQEILSKSTIGFLWKSQRWMSIETSLAYSNYQYFPMLRHDRLFDEWFHAEGLKDSISQPEFHIDIEWSTAEIGQFTLDSVPIAWSNDKPFSKVYFHSDAIIGEGKWSFRPRFRAGAVHWWQERERSLANHFFLGGSHTVRGWGYRQLQAPLYAGQSDDIRPGGELMLMNSMELRFEWRPEFYGIAFVDSGRVWERAVDQFSSSGSLLESGVHLSQMLPSIGAGLLIPTFAGDILTTAAYQLKQDNELIFPPSRFSVHLVTIKKL